MAKIELYLIENFVSIKTDNKHFCTTTILFSQTSVVTSLLIKDNATNV